MKKEYQPVEVNVTIIKPIDYITINLKINDDGTIEQAD